MKKKKKKTRQVVDKMQCIAATEYSGAKKYPKLYIRSLDFRCWYLDLYFLYNWFTVVKSILERLC